MGPNVLNRFRFPRSFFYPFIGNLDVRHVGVHFGTGAEGKQVVMVEVSYGAVWYEWKAEISSFTMVDLMLFYEQYWKMAICFFLNMHTVFAGCNVIIIM